jgi:hypothetical protein
MARMGAPPAASRFRELPAAAQPAKSCRAVKALGVGLPLPLPSAERNPSAVSDIFREVEEEVRRERLERIWKEYGDYIIAAAALLILAAAGYRLWTFYEARERARASNEYLAAEQLMQSGQASAAAKIFAQLSQNAPGGYAKLAKLQTANTLAAAGNTSAALTLYRSLVQDSDEMLSAIARLRAAWLMVEDSPKSDVEAMVQPLTAQGSPWGAPAREILAYADYRRGATQQALAEFQDLARDAKAPPGVRGRSKAMTTFLAAGGAQNVGNIPFPAAPPLPKGAPPANAPAPATGTSAPSGATGAPATPPPAKAAPAQNTTPQGQNPK